MRILVHDFSGRPFQVQLSRELAARHHDVLHVSCVSFSTGKGNLVHRDDDPPWFQLAEIDLGEEFEKYSYAKRIVQERRYAANFVETARRFEPQLIVSANVPLFAQHAILKWTREQGISFVFWQQDIYSIAMRAMARQKLPLVGDLIGRGFERMERRMLNQSDAVVCISPD